MRPNFCAEHGGRVIVLKYRLAWEEGLLRTTSGEALSDSHREALRVVTGSGRREVSIDPAKWA